MDDESNIETNENNLNVNSENKSVEKTGNWFSNQSTPVKAILGIVTVCCIGIIVLLGIEMLNPGGINWEFNTNTNDKFPNEVNVSGVTFYIPEGYTLITTFNVSDDLKYFTYSNGTGFIEIAVLPFSKTEKLSSMKSSAVYTNIDEYASYGGYSGYSADRYDYFASRTNKVFVFEKGGKTFSIETDEEINFDEDIPKIIG